MVIWPTFGPHGAVYCQRPSLPQPSVYCKFRKYKGHKDRANKKFDIAVLILQSPFWINEYIIPTCLPTPRLQLQNGLGVISGLGITQNKTLSENLKRAEIEIMPGSKCKKELRKISSYEKLFNGSHMLCGLGKRREGSRIDSCQG